jgi:hypothetical protein
MANHVGSQFPGCVIIRALRVVRIMSVFVPKRGHRLRISRLELPRAVTPKLRGGDVGASGNTIASPVEVRRRTHRSRVTADGNNFRRCDGFAVMRVEGSPRPETGPSTDTPCAISATPFIYATPMIASTIDAGSKSKFGDCEADFCVGSISDICVALQQYHPHIRNLLLGGHHAGASR